MSTINVTAVFPASGAINVTAALPTSAPINVLAGIPSTTINVSATFGTGMQGEPGEPGEPGAPGAPGTSYNPQTNWFALVSGSVSESPEAAITGGIVTPYHYNGGVTRYRYEASDESADAFYTTFDGTNLTGLVATKALTF